MPNGMNKYMNIVGCGQKTYVVVMWKHSIIIVDMKQSVAE